MSHIIALDFDGVLCHSARETAASGWLGGKKFWPEWQNKELPQEVEDNFVRIRPLLETGYQSIPFVRMAYDNVSYEDLKDNCEEMCHACMDKYNLTKEELVSEFGSCRDKWIQNDLASWVAKNSFFQPPFSDFMELKEKYPTYILTTKQERFAHELLRSQQAVVAEEMLFGFESGKKKEVYLQEFLQKNPKSTIHFVEDRMDTLTRVRKAIPNLRLKLYLASWGYNTEYDLEAAAELGITILESSLKEMHL